MQEWIDAGLYDPVRDATNGRAELLEWLSRLGFSIEELRDADERLALGAAAGDRRLVPGERRSHADAVARSGLPIELFDALATAFGLTPIPGAPAGEVGYVDDEVAALAAVGSLVGEFTEAEAIAFVRVIGAGLARMAEAGVSMFLLDVEGPHVLAGESEYELARKVDGGVALLEGFLASLDPIFRRHVLQAIGRTRETLIGATERAQYRFAVGFIDLVGFTSMSESMDAVALAGFLRDFEARAYDVATSHRARVVKLIGDEVMFVATDPARACVAGRALIEAFTTDGVVPRGGLAYGDVLLRAGDYFGSVVNLASRLVDQAVPGELLVTRELAAASGVAVEPAGRRQLKGFAEPVIVFSLSADQSAPDGSLRDR